MEDIQLQNKKAARKRNIIMGIMGVLVVLLAAVVVYLFMSVSAKDKALDNERTAREQAELDREQALISEEFDELNRQFAQIEDQQIVIRDDSVKRDLMDKYEAAKLRMEQLQEELNSERQRSAAEIAQLRNEINTLREILRNYLEQIDQLTQENQALRSENEDLRQNNDRLNDRVAQTTRQNEELSERMTLAERLNVTGLQLKPLNRRGKDERKVDRATQLMVTFTIPQNNSTPVGEKTIYMRIISPSGQLLGNDGSFSFEGTSLPCTAKKIIDYEGVEIGGVTIYWDVNTPLTAGDYTVELFADNFRLISRSFNLR